MTQPPPTAAEPLPDEKPHGDPLTGAPSTGPGEPDPLPPAAGGPTPGAPYETPDQMTARLQELTADLQRLQAEYVNYKRRVDRDRDLVLQNAKLSILTALLPVLDDVERARQHEELSGGFKAVADSLERIVSGQGLVRYGVRGDAFDPRIHEALMQSLSPEVTTTTVDTIVQAGYTFADRVVRPAMVTVVDPDPDPDPEAAGADAGASTGAGAEGLETAPSSAPPAADQTDS